ncbi:hypothetical protein [Streptomyces sp. NPDC051001]|uniref:hypothetical protein n=1 Tax=Streptomyces sp. NPDC051001 TaxID=3155795 RepID=UPI00342D4966
MTAVATAFAARGLSQLNLSKQAIAVTESRLGKLPINSLARLFLQQQLTIHLADANAYREALRSARQTRNLLNSWKREHERPYTSAQQEVLSGLSQAIESNVRLLKTATTRRPKLTGAFIAPTNEYWRERNTVLEWGFATYVRDSFEEMLQVTLGRPVSRFSERESPRTALTTYLLESEFAGHYRRVLAARSLLGQQYATEVDLADAKRVKPCIQLLRQSRDAKSYESLLKLLISSGPLSALTEEVRRAADEVSWPPRKEDFIALKIAGSLLPQPAAKHALRALLNMPPQAQVQDPNSYYLADSQIWPAIRSILPVADENAAVSARMREIASSGSSLTYSELQATARVVDWSKVGVEEENSWRGWFDNDKPEDASLLEQELSQAFARLGDMAPLERYISGAENLTTTEVSTLIDFGSENKEFRLPVSVASRVAESLGSELDELMLDASKGSFSFGVVDSVLLAGIFSSQYPDHSIWEKVREVVVHPRVNASQKSGIFEWVSRYPEVWPPDFALTERDVPLLLNGDEDWMGAGARYSALRFLCALNLLSQEEASERVMNLATSESSKERGEAARTLPIVRTPETEAWAVTVLDILTRDPSPAVRSMAGSSIGATYRNVRPENLRKIDRLARRCLDSDGVWIPLRTLHGMLNELNHGHAIRISGVRESVSDLAINHIHYSVRKVANRILHFQDS